MIANPMAQEVAIFLNSKSLHTYQTRRASRTRPGSDGSLRRTASLPQRRPQSTCSSNNLYNNVECTTTHIHTHVYEPTNTNNHKNRLPVLTKLKLLVEDWVVSGEDVSELNGQAPLRSMSTINIKELPTPHHLPDQLPSYEYSVLVNGCTLIKQPMPFPLIIPLLPVNQSLELLDQPVERLLQVFLPGWM